MMKIIKTRLVILGVASLIAALVMAANHPAPAGHVSAVATPNPTVAESAGQVAEDSAVPDSSSHAGQAADAPKSTPLSPPPPAAVVTPAPTWWGDGDNDADGPAPVPQPTPLPTPYPTPIASPNPTRCGQCGERSGPGPQSAMIMCPMYCVQHVQ